MITIKTTRGDTPCYMSVVSNVIQSKLKLRVSDIEKEYFYGVNSKLGQKYFLTIL